MVVQKSFVGKVQEVERVEAEEHGNEDTAFSNTKRSNEWYLVIHA